MGLFNKKGGDIPEIPEAPKLPELPAMPAATHVPELPSLPGAAKNDNLNQEMVKSAIGDAPTEASTMLPSVPAQPAAPVVEVAAPPVVGETSPIPSLPEPEVAAIPAPHVEKTGPEPIFVRIDKFQDAKESLNDIQGKTKEMKEILRKINDVRRQEEEELNGWDQELEKLKGMLAEVESEIFNQI